MKLASLKPLLSAHYILNPVACLLYVFLKTVQPFCVWLFPDDECQISWVSKVVQYFASSELWGFALLLILIRSIWKYVWKFQRILPSAVKERHFETWIVHEKRWINHESNDWFVIDFSLDLYHDFQKKENMSMPTNLCDMFLLSHIFDSCKLWVMFEH